MNKHYRAFEQVNWREKLFSFLELRKLKPYRFELANLVDVLTENKSKRIKCLHEVLSAKKRESEILGQPKKNTPGYRSYKNINTLIDFIENEFDDLDFSKPEILKLDCLDKIRHITEKHSAWGQNETFKEAYKCEDCKYEIVDGERKKIGSWRTLFRRVKNYYPELFERTSAK